LAELAGANQERFSKVLSVIQRLDPPGLGASSRKESLLIQLEASGLKPESLEYRVVAECYEKLLDSGGGPAQIATWLSVPKIEIEQALVNIRKLDPRPARRFGRSASYIYPDFSIEWWQGQLQGFLNDDEIPRIRVAPSYLGMLKEPDQFSQEEISFVRRKVKNAILLIKGIEQRRTTLKRLLEYILAEQVEFFQHGKECLKPLSMAEAAAALGCHPSTISRAVHAKYVETPLGIFELKLFFTSRIEESSKAGLKERIRKLIAEEDSQNPYSDAAIARLLARERTHLARRTVAKYRNQLGIPSARKRRR
jgi:RNA polymerase sigma-54 factor